MSLHRTTLGHMKLMKREFLSTSTMNKSGSGQLWSLDGHGTICVARCRKAANMIGGALLVALLMAASTTPTVALEIGFMAEVYNAAGAGVFGDGDAFVENINEAEQLVALGGADGTSQPLTLNGSPFPGATADDFAARFTGFAEIIDGNSAFVFFHVSSDEGFRLRVNGAVVSQFVGTTTNSDTVSALITLNDGDLIELTYFERNGGQFLNFTRDFDGLLATTADRAFVGQSESGILITHNPVPEPTSAMLCLTGAGLLALRRRPA